MIAKNLRGMVTACLVILTLFVIWRKPSWFLGERKKSELTPRETAELYHRNAEIKANLFSKNSWEDGLAQGLSARALFWESGLPGKAAQVSETIGRLYARLQKPDLSLQYYRLALDDDKVRSDDSARARINREMARIYGDRGDYGDAFNLLEASRLQCRTSGDVKGEIMALHLLSKYYSRTGRPDQARPLLEEALRRGHSLGDIELEANTLFYYGYFHHLQGEYREALTFYERALPGIRVHGDRYLEAAILNNIGDLQREFGLPLKALSNLERAASWFGDMGLTQLGACYMNIGEIYGSLGEKQQALYFFEKSRALFHERGLHNEEASVLYDLGKLYDETGGRDRALPYLKRALAMFRENRNLNAQITVHTAIGDNYLAGEDPGAALKHLYEGLSLAARLGQDAKRASILASLGDAHGALADYMEAMCYFEEALALQREKKLPHQEAGTLLRIARNHLNLNRLGDASTYVFAALSLVRDIGNRQEEASALHTLSRIQARERQPREALATNEKALDILESLRAKIMGRHMRTSFFTSIHELYAYRLDLLMDLAGPDPMADYGIQAFQVSERARARTLLDELVQSPQTLESPGEQALFLERQRIQNELSGRIDYRIRLGLDDDRKKIDETDSEIENLVAEFRGVEDRIRSQDPHYAYWTQPVPATYFEIQEELLDDETVLLEFSFGERFGYLWLITRDNIRAHRLASRERIEDKARQAYNLLKARNEKIPFETIAERRIRIKKAEKDWPDVSKELSGLLLGPIWDHIEGKRLVIVADGVLQFLPFGALSVPSQHHANPDPVILHHNVVSAPSASVLLALKRDAGRAPAPKLLALFADPVFDERVEETHGSTVLADKWRNGTSCRPVLAKLPFTRLEAEQIIQNVSGNELKCFLGHDADLAAVRNPDLRNYRILHFATHGLINTKHPELSGLAFSMFDRKGQPQKWFLSQSDVYHLRLNAELVVLSACQTALGKEVKGEGLIGLTRGFMYAGTPRVAASLWKVEDRATAELMARFYQKMLRENLSPDSALRQAQIGLREQPRWRAPYYWASFVFQGLWY